MSIRRCSLLASLILAAPSIALRTAPNEANWVTDVRYGKQDQHRSHEQWLRLRNGLDLPTQHGFDDADGGRHQTVPGVVVPVA